jgi:hypothetical protein
MRSRTSGGSTRHREMVGSALTPIETPKGRRRGESRIVRGAGKASADKAPGRMAAGSGGQGASGSKPWRDSKPKRASRPVTGLRAGGQGDGLCRGARP